MSSIIKQVPAVCVEGSKRLMSPTGGDGAEIVPNRVVHTMKTRRTNECCSNKGQ